MLAYEYLSPFYGAMLALPKALFKPTAENELINPCVEPEDKVVLISDDFDR